MDAAHRQTDRILADLEREIKSTYQKAYTEMRREMADIASKIEMNPDMPVSERLALMNKRDRLNTMCQQCADKIQNANSEAVRYINRDMVSVYRTNYGYAAEQLQFGMIDNTAIKQILTEEASPFTKLAIDASRDKDVILRSLKSEFTTSLLKGESIRDMAKRIKAVTERNLADSIRIARTETTRVENSARIDVGKKGEKLGFKMLKEWVATSDDRTRDAHAAADGQRVPLDEPFIVGGEKLMYPGDFSLGASPSNTINCRCTVINIIDDGSEVKK